MANTNIPTDEGKRRWSHTGGFTHDFGEPVACACYPTCARRCDGECGCEACSLSFTEFCDVAGFLSEEPLEGERLAEALRRYRGES